MKLKENKNISIPKRIAVIFLAVYQLAIAPRLSGDTFIYKESKVSKGDIVLGIEESGTVTLNSSELDYNLKVSSLDLITDCVTDQMSFPEDKSSVYPLPEL